MAGSPPPGDMFQHHMLASTVKFSAANCCTVLNFNLWIQMHGYKQMSDAFEPPSHLIFFPTFLPVKMKSSDVVSISSVTFSWQIAVTCRGLMTGSIPTVIIHDYSLPHGEVNILALF